MANDFKKLSTNVFGLKRGDRVQRIGWQITAIGTIRLVRETIGGTFFIVTWDFRGIDEDHTIVRATDVLPASISNEMVTEFNRH